MSVGASARPTISLVTPSFNQARFFARALDSVLAQRADLHEYFVYDGGSRDGSREILEARASNLDHWVSGPDQGQAAVLADGFARASGDVFGWLNSDDVLMPGALETVRAAFAESPELDVVTGQFCLVDAEERILRLGWTPRDPVWWVRRGVTRICQAATFFRRELYHRVGGVDRRLECVMDTDLWCRFIRAGGRWRGIERLLAARRRHPEAKGARLVGRYAAERQQLRVRFPELRPGPVRRTMGRLLQLGAPGFLWSLARSARSRGRSLTELGAAGAPP